MKLVEIKDIKKYWIENYDPSWVYSDELFDVLDKLNWSLSKEIMNNLAENGIDFSMSFIVNDVGVKTIANRFRREFNRIDFGNNIIFCVQQVYHEIEARKNMFHVWSFGPSKDNLQFTTDLVLQVLNRLEKIKAFL